MNPIESKGLPNLSSFIDNLSGKFFMSKEELEKKLNDWKTQKLNIGVIGGSGCGKSTLINSLRGIYPSDPGAAKIDVKEVKIFPTPYTFPLNENIVIWDLPGISPSYPLESYLDQITLQKETHLDEKELHKEHDRFVSIPLPKDYDLFLLCTATRFYEHDYNLAMKLVKREKSFAFVHLKFDQDINGREDEIEKSLNEDDISKLMEELREYIRIESNKIFVGEKRPEIFIISARKKKLYGKVVKDNTKLYEFNKLEEWIKECFPEEKQNAFILSIMPSGKRSIQEKCNVLRKKIKYASLLSGAGGLVPLPGLSLGFDSAICAEQIINYIYQLNISKKNIENICTSFGVRYEDLAPILKSNPLFNGILSLVASFGVVYVKQGLVGLNNLLASLSVPLVEFLAKYFSKYFAANTVEEVAKFLFPGIGILMGGVLSASSTYYILTTTLDSFEKGLLDIFDFCIKKSSIQTLN